jgi:hypothetical protein
MYIYTVEIIKVDTKRWYLNGKLHREDGPAIENSDGTKRWYLNGKMHRTDGPAVEYVSGTKEWYFNDKLHRTDGPAVEYANGKKYWYLNGERYSEVEWRNQINKLKAPKAHCEDKLVEVDGVKYKLVKI